MRLPNLLMIEGFFARSRPLLAVLGITLFFASGAPAQTTKKNPLPVAPNVANPYTCSIAEFRTMALTTHDPQERGDLAAQWLKANGPSCSISQVLLLSSNRPQWLGSANTVRIAGVFDQIIENKLKNDPLALKYLYGSEGATSAGGGSKKGAEETSAAGAAAAPAAAGAPPPGTVTLAVGSGAGFCFRSPQPEDLSRKLPLDSEPKPVFPPERGKQMKNYFGKLRTEMIRNYFMENSSPGNCPEGLSFSKTAGCESKNPVAWKFGEALPSSAKTFPIPEPLLGKLSFYPGYQFVRLGIDVLALEKDSGKVADAVLNLGKTN